MSAPLALSVSYQDYPPGVMLPCLDYEGFLWSSLKQEEEMMPEPVHGSEGLPQQAQAVHSSEGLPQQADAKDLEEKDPPEISPRPSSSGTFSHYTPDSATSPNQPAPTPQSQKGETSEKKGKTRIAFSQQQLQILQHRFQRQKYLSPQQIRELGSTLGLSYKQVKTWFQNQRMKFKRTQKETVWMKTGMYQPQTGVFPCLSGDAKNVNPVLLYKNVCLEINPAYHHGYTANDKYFPALANAHDSYASSPSYNQGLNYSSDHNLVYDNPSNFQPFVNGEEWDESFFGKTAGPCFGQQAVGYISQQKMNFYHGFSASVEYATVKMEDSYPFPNVPAAATAYPSQPAIQHYQTPLQIPGAQSHFNA